MIIIIVILYMAIEYIIIMNCQMEKMVTYESSDRHNRIDGTFQEVGSIEYRSNYKKIDDIKVPMKFTIVRVLPNGIHEEFW